MFNPDLLPFNVIGIINQATVTIMDDDGGELADLHKSGIQNFLFQTQATQSLLSVSGPPFLQKLTRPSGFLFLYFLKSL